MKSLSSFILGLINLIMIITFLYVINSNGELKEELRRARATLETVESQNKFLKEENTGLKDRLLKAMDLNLENAKRKDGL